MVDDGGGMFISTLTRQQSLKREADIIVRDHNSKINGGGLKKYRGCRIATFPTIEMAVIAFDTIVFHLRGKSSASRLNFPHYVSYIKRILEDCFP